MSQSMLLDTIFMLLRSMDISYDPNLVVFNTDACVITKQNCYLNQYYFDRREFQVGISIINKIASCLSDIPETM